MKVVIHVDLLISFSLPLCFSPSCPASMKPIQSCCSTESLTSTTGSSIWSGLLPSPLRAEVTSVTRSPWSRQPKVSPSIWSQVNVMTREPNPNMLSQGTFSIKQVCCIHIEGGDGDSRRLQSQIQRQKYLQAVRGKDRTTNYLLHHLHSVSPNRT